VLLLRALWVRYVGSIIMVNAVAVVCCQWT
jgi:hypothetical protein